MKAAPKQKGLDYSLMRVKTKGKNDVEFYEEEYDGQLVIRAMQTGGTLAVDEFDVSIHPMALMSIINVFHNDDVNVHHTQIVFNTHNPIFLNSNLFRRDEIKFVERDDQMDLSNWSINLPEERLNAIEKQIAQRTRELLAIPI